MDKNLKLSLILYGAFFSIIMAFFTIGNFFRGVGIAFVGLSLILCTIIVINFTCQGVISRTRDLFISACVFLGLEFIVYFIFEFSIGGYKTLKFFTNFQIVLSIFSILFFAYLVFRFIMELKNKKMNWLEVLLGNKKSEKKTKKAKEISNGSLCEKPISTESNDNSKFENNISETDNNSQSDTVILKDQIVLTDPENSEQ